MARRAGDAGARTQDRNRTPGKQIADGQNRVSNASACVRVRLPGREDEFPLPPGLLREKASARLLLTLRV
jgi:hypothetical protein